VHYQEYWQNTLKDNEALKKEKERLVSEKESLLSEKARLLDKISGLETQVSQIKANTGVLQESADNALQQQYEQMLNMVCYSMVRGYPSIEMRSKKKQGHRNKGTLICRCGVKCIPNQNISSPLYSSHFFTYYKEKYPHISPGDCKNLQGKADTFYKIFVNVTQETMMMSGIPESCLEEINETQVERKYEMVYEMISYVRDMVTNKRSAAMASITRVCRGKYL
jgi:hypothetical protein